MRLETIIYPIKKAVADHFDGLWSILCQEPYDINDIFIMSMFFMYMEKEISEEFMLIALDFQINPKYIPDIYRKFVAYYNREGKRLKRPRRGWINWCKKAIEFNRGILTP